MATRRPTLNQLAPDGYRSVLALDAHVRSSIEPALLELVNIRVSMINGCAFCVDVHSADAIAGGEDVRRLLALAAWEESTLFSDEERAALALADSVTTLDGGVDDDIWNGAVEAFGEPLTGELVVAIATMNVLNRVAISTRMPSPELNA